MMDGGPGIGSTRTSRRTKLGRKLSRRLSLVTRVPNLISMRLKHEIRESRDSQRRNLEITAIAPDKTQRIVSNRMYMGVEPGLSY